MSVVKKRLVLDLLDEAPYELLALHCSLEPYRLAFLLNQKLGLQLRRNRSDVYIWYPEGEGAHACYEYENPYNYLKYYLVKNRSHRDLQEQPASGLFPTIQGGPTYLVPEHKKADYFLKVRIEASHFSMKKTCTGILQIPQVVAAYSMNKSQIKSKNNLIFE